jgi:Skp family chaperone for outer membrane proteins
MAHRTNWMVAALAATASLLPAQDRLPAQDSKAPGAQPADATAARKAQITVGVVDLDKAIELYPKAIAERERLQALSKKFSAEIEAISKQFDALRSDLSILKEGSEKRESMEFELRMLGEQRKGLAELRKNQFDRELEKFELAVYRDLEVAIAEVAKLRGVQIVLRTRSAPALEDASAKETTDLQRQQLQVYDRRQVWFASDEVDLTPALIKYMQVPVNSKTGDGKTGDGKTGDGKQTGAEKPAAGSKGGGL